MAAIIWVFNMQLPSCPGWSWTFQVNVEAVMLWQHVQQCFELLVRSPSEGFQEGGGRSYGIHTSQLRNASSPPACRLMLRSQRDSARFMLKNLGSKCPASRVSTTFAFKLALSRSFHV